MLPVLVAGACKRGRAQDMLRCLQLRVPGMWTMRAHIAQTKGRARERETKGIRPIRMRAMCQRGNTPAADRHKFSSALSCVCPRCTLNSLRAAVPVRGRRDQRSEIVGLVDRLCFSLGAIKGLERADRADVPATSTSIDGLALITASRGANTCSLSSPPRRSSCSS